MSSYTIKLTNGNNLVTIQDGQADTTMSSITIFGKNFAGYGLPLNENQVKMLENFSRSSSPPNPLIGQLWWDSQNNQMNVFREGGHWKAVSGPTVLNTAPFSDTRGDLWWNTTTGQLNAYTGTDWKAIGPSYTIDQGKSGTETVTIMDSNGYPHVGVYLYAGGEIVGILSKEAAYPISIDGISLSMIKPGLNLNIGTYAGNIADDSAKLGGVLANNFLRSDVDDFTTGKLGIKNNNGLTLGLNDDLSVSVTGPAIKFESMTLGRDVWFTTNNGSVQTLSLAINGTTGKVTVPQIPTFDADVTNKLYVDSMLSTTISNYLKIDGSTPLEGNLILTQNDTYSLGSPSVVFKSIYVNNVITSRVNASSGLYTNLQLSTPTISSMTDDNVTSKGYVDAADSALSTQIVTASSTIMSTLVGNAPASMRNFGNISLALNNDPDFYNTMLAKFAEVATLVDPTFIGNVVINNNLTVNGQTTTKDLTVNGNLVVNGTTTSLNVVNMDVADLNITVAKNAATPVAAEGAGITVAGANATMKYSNANDSWAFNKSLTAPTFYGTAMQAKYADLAENYVADADYEPGTVLDFGGEFDVTLSDGKNMTRVAGVVSTKPAYLMNTDCEGKHIVALALQGRVPCKVIGFIQKGDILVSYGEGVAKRSLDPKPGTIIGKALSSHNGETSLIEIAVGRG